MSTSRREFLKFSAVLGGTLGADRWLPASLRAAFDAPRPPERAPNPLRILILGGTGFIGPNQVRYAVARGHQVTLFNRGKTNPGLFKGMANIDERVGDRAPKPGNCESLKEGEWDVVIDNPTTRPLRRIAPSARRPMRLRRHRLDSVRSSKQAFLSGQPVARAGAPRAGR